MPRYSSKLGPFRLNFSKSGFSYSFGVKGARINTGPRGTFVTFSYHGITYRRRIDHEVHDRRIQPAAPTQDRQVLQHTITSAAIDQLTDAESKDFINELTEKSRKLSYVKWLGIPLTILSILTIVIYFNQVQRTTYIKDFFLRLKADAVKLHPTPTLKSDPITLLTQEITPDLLDSTTQGWYKVKSQDTIGYISRQYATPDSTVKMAQEFTPLDDHPNAFFTILLVAVTAGILFCIFLNKVDKKCLLIEIHYEMDDKIHPVYDKFIEHFSEILTSAKAWQYLHSQGTSDLKRHAGAQQLITRIGVATITPNKKPERFFITNVQIPNIRLKNSDLYFFPERLVIKRGNEFGAVFYKNMRIESILSKFIEEEAVPPDAEIIDWTWRFLNKNGTPDKRFNNNRRLPICLYSQYHFSSATGINEVLTTSRKGAFDNFSKFLTAIGQLQNRMALT